MASDCTSSWSGRSDGNHAQGVAVFLSHKLTPMMIEVTTVNEHIKRCRIHHSLGVISLVSVYALTEASDLTVNDAFYARLESVVDQCPWRDTLLVMSHQRWRDTLLVMGDFSASTGIDRDGYEMCGGPHGSGTVNQNSTKFLDVARSRGLGVAGSWYQHRQTHH